MVTRLVADLLGELKMNVREIHSRKSQSYRTKVSDEFRKSKGLILVTSDVSARGVDYPDVTLVVQVRSQLPITWLLSFHFSRQYLAVASSVLKQSLSYIDFNPTLLYVTITGWLAR